MKNMLPLMHEKDVNSFQRLRVRRDIVAPSLFLLPIINFCAVMWLMECVLWCYLLQGETPGEENPVSQEGVPTGYEAVSLIEAVNGPCNQFFSVDGGKLLCVLSESRFWRLLNCYSNWCTCGSRLQFTSFLKNLQLMTKFLNSDYSSATKNWT